MAQYGLTSRLTEPEDWLSVRTINAATSAPPVIVKSDYSDRLLAERILERDLVRNKAIHRTLITYEIVPTDAQSGKPTMPSGTSVAADYDGKIAHWRVVAEDDRIRTNLDARGNPVRVGPINIPGARAYTDGSGITIVYENSFTSPEYLALILSHEKEHFEQYTTKGRADKLSINEREVEAWRKTEREAPLLGLSVNDPTINAKVTRESFEKAVEKERWRQKWSAGLLKPRGIAQATPRSTAETAAIGKRFEDLSEVVAREIKFAREEAKRQKADEEYRELMAEVKRQSDAARPAELHPTDPRAGPPGYVPAVPSVPGRNGPVALNPKASTFTGLLVRDIASRACSAPPRSFDRELGAVDWDQFRKEKNVEAYAEGLLGCESRVVLRLIELGRVPGARVDAASVRAAAAPPGNGSSGGGSVPPAQDHDPVWGKIGIPKR